ncbi:MAG: hypothetical protein JJ897_16960 [Marinibacterium sp.]|nr:hypothetical protein [Marinibacterium sp.]
MSLPERPVQPDCLLMGGVVVAYGKWGQWSGWTSSTPIHGPTRWMDGLVSSSKSKNIWDRSTTFLVLPLADAAE